MKKIYIFICSLSVSYTVYSQTPSLLLDINATGNSVRNTSSIFNWGETGYFVADDGVHGPELWKTDGTSLGTSLFKDINEGAYGSTPHAFGILNNKLLFGATDNSNLEKLWISDGTEQGTIVVKSISPYYNPASDIQFMTIAGNQAFFVADDAAHGLELWVTDGTETGTKMVKDIQPIGETGSFNYTGSLTVLNNKTYFAANESVHGTELWVSDGTEAGTYLVKDINPGTGSALAYPNNLLLLNGKLFFIADDGVNGNELWVSDGTEAGTHIVKDIRAGSASGCSASFEMTLYNNKVYFQADNGNMAIGRELWSSDGSVDGTQMLKDINAGSNYSDAKFFSELNGKLYFWAMKNTSPVSTVYQLWMTDGTSDGTVVAADTYTGNYTTGPTIIYRGNLYTTYSDATYGYQLFRFDQGTASLKIIGPENMPVDACDVNGMGTTLSICNGNLLYPAVYDVSKGIELYSFSSGSSGFETTALEGNFSVYPNPANESATVVSPAAGKKIIHLTLFDMAGHTEYSSELSEFQVRMPTSGFPDGVYLLRIAMNDEIAWQKIVIRH
jgi:ELWxxDGT repeat protein